MNINIQNTRGSDLANLYVFVRAIAKKFVIEQRIKDESLLARKHKQKKAREILSAFDPNSPRNLHNRTKSTTIIQSQTLSFSFPPSNPPFLSNRFPFSFHFFQFSSAPFVYFFCLFPSPLCLPFSSSTPSLYLFIQLGSFSADPDVLLSFWFLGFGVRVAWWILRIAPAF